MKGLSDSAIKSLMQIGASSTAAERKLICEMIHNSVTASKLKEQTDAAKD